MDELLQRLRTRAADTDAATDMADVVPPRVNAPASREELHAIERRLGFTLPELLVRIYSEVGDGGFGPAYGFLGLVAGALNEDGTNAVGVYEMMRRPGCEDAFWRWPTGLLPLIHMGCEMFLCSTTSRYLHARPDDGSANYLPA